jgi:AhpD family alkylhydroperoxidase
MRKDYPDYYNHVKEIMTRLGDAIPGPMSGFAQMHQASVEEGALSTKTKELIALAIAISVRCDGCISFHVHDAIKAGANSQEIAEAIGVAVLMGGGPAVVYGSEALEAFRQFELSKD